MRARWLVLVLGWVTSLAWGRVPESQGPRVFNMTSDGRWLLSTPVARFDASALLRTPDGAWWVANDKQAPLFRCELSAGESGVLSPAPAWFPLEALRAAAGDPAFQPDLEGLARDSQGRVYLCTEKQRWIFRTPARGGPVERLEIDWKPVRRWLSAVDLNASWEGIAVGGDRLYLANERSTGRIIVVDLGTLKVIDDFQALPVGSKALDVHYSDLCWHDGSLWVLCRAHQVILRVDPATRRTLAQFHYGPIERAPANAYSVPLGIGMAEGLWVDDTHLWVLVDNNGFARKADPKDTRPLLFRCPRPDTAPVP